MTYYFYIDNFRGFSSTFIPITDVNFLVGENSTGKTSVLSLIKLLSSPHFLYSTSFGDEYINFGHFSDMVSAHSEDKTYFSIGNITEEDRPNNQAQAQAIVNTFLVTFMPEAGLPRIARMTICRGVEKLSIRFRGSTVYYNRERYDTPTTVDEVISTLLPQWNREHRESEEEFKKRGFKKLATSGYRWPIMFLSSILSKSSKSPAKDADDLMLKFPPRFLVTDLIWLAPIRTKPKRTYDELTLDFSPEGLHTPYLIRRMLRSKGVAAAFNSFIDKVGKASGLFQSVKIKNFGKGVTAPFEVDVILDGKALNLSTVGYGVSQSLPVFVEILTRAPGSWFAIQQPEVHLHPRAQAALGDLFFDSAIHDHKSFLIETHSDFTIDRFRMNYAKDVGKPNSQILFFERKDRHNTVTSLKIGDKGELPVDQPDSYRGFFIREEMALLEI